MEICSSDDLNLKFGPNQQHVILLQHLIPGFVPAAHFTDEEVAKVLLTKYQSLCPSSLPMELEREINRWRHRWADIDDKPQTAISALNNTESFPNIRNFLLLFVTLPITSCEPERVFSKGPRQPSEARWEQSDLRPLLSSQPIVFLMFYRVFII